MRAWLLGLMGYTLFMLGASVSALTVEVPAAGQSDGTTLAISVEDAVLMSLQNNRGLRVQQFEPMIAGAFAQIERGVYDPELYANVTFEEESASETANSTGQQFSVESRSSNGEVGVRQSLPTGTDVTLSVGVDRSVSNRAPEQQQARYGLTVTQQLLRDFGPSVRLAAIRQADYETEASLYELRGYTEALVADVETAYWEYVAARESIQVYERSKEVAQAQLDEILSRIEVGDLPENEAAAARAELALRHQDLIDGESALRVREYTLLRMIYPRLPGLQAVQLTASSEPSKETSFDPDLNNRTSLALRSRPELRQAEFLLERDRLETVITRNGRLPRLELFINLGKSGYSDTFRSSFREVDGDNYDASVGIEFSTALGNRAAKGYDRVAQSTLAQAEEAYANLEDLVRFDVLLAVNEMERARKQITASEETRRYRAQSLQTEQDRFEVGTSTALDVTQAQRNLVESEIAEIRSLVDFQIARIQLYLAEGSLLERRGLLAE